MWTAGLLLNVLIWIVPFHPWPLHAALLFSRDALDDLADEVVAGHPVDEPRWIGLYRIVSSATKGERVALIFDANPAGRSALVRFPPGVEAGSGKVERSFHGPMRNVDLDIPLGGGWRYQNEE